MDAGLVLEGILLRRVVIVIPDESGEERGQFLLSSHESLFLVVSSSHSVGRIESVSVSKIWTILERNWNALKTIETDFSKSRTKIPRSWFDLFSHFAFSFYHFLFYSNVVIYISFLRITGTTFPTSGFEHGTLLQEPARILSKGNNTVGWDG